MSENDIRHCGKQDLIDLSTFWQGLIDDLEKKNPDDVQPEMREALLLTESRLEELTLVSERS